MTTLRAFHHSLPMMLLRAREMVMHEFRPHLRRHNITEQQWRVLRALHSDGAMSANTLSSSTLISLPSLTRIIRSLSDRVLLTKRMSSDDQRSIIIELTNVGRNMIALASPEAEEIYRRITDRFGDEPLDTLYELLHQLEHSLQKPK